MRIIFPLDKQGGAAWAQSRGLIPQSGDWDHPARWVTREKLPKPPLPSAPSRPMRDRLASLISFEAGVSEARKEKLLQWMEEKNLPLSHLSGVDRIRLYEGSHEGRPGGAHVVGTYIHGNIHLWQEAGGPDLMHEIGHSIHLTKGLLPTSTLERLTKAYENATKNDEGFPSQYAKKNEKEFVAECYAVYMQFRDNLERRNPEMGAILATVMEDLDRASAT